MNVHLTVQVPRSPDLDELIERLQQRLESLLTAFQPELVQLQGRLVRHSSREGVVCSLNLHLPTTQLSSEDGAATAQLAFRTASTELVRQVNKHLERLRSNRSRRGAVPPEPAAPEAATGEAGLRLSANGDGQTKRADLAGYFGAQYEYLRSFIRRQIELRERLGELAEGSLEPNEVLDEVILEALEAQPQTPGISRHRWMLVLTARAIRRLSKTYGDHDHGQELRHLADQDPPATDEPDPEELASTTEMMGQLARALAVVPPIQRHDLVLYWLEGFRTQELADISNRSRKEVEASLRQAEAILRQRQDLSPQLRMRLQSAHLPQGARA